MKLLAILVLCIYSWNIEAASDKVDVALYYETLCPYCKQFITGQLVRAYVTIPDIINITIVPYGNAHETYDSSTQTYQFTCQHGPEECVGNLIHVRIRRFLFFFFVKERFDFLYSHVF